METFSVGQVIKSPTGNQEWEIVDTTTKLIAVRARSSGMQIEWWEKNRVTGQIAAGVFEIKQ